MGTPNSFCQFARMKKHFALLPRVGAQRANPLKPLGHRGTVQQEISEETEGGIKQKLAKITKRGEENPRALLLSLATLVTFCSTSRPPQLRFLLFNVSSWAFPRNAKFV